MAKAGCASSSPAAASPASPPPCGPRNSARASPCWRRVTGRAGPSSSPAATSGRTGTCRPTEVRRRAGTLFSRNRFSTVWAPAWTGWRAREGCYSRARRATPSRSAPASTPSKRSRRWQSVFWLREAEILTGTALEALTEDRGTYYRRAGVFVGEDKVDYAADAVVLASGGFAANPELVGRYIIEGPGRMLVRAHPRSTGDGFLAALEKGALASAGLDEFYGRNLPAPPARVSSRTVRRGLPALRPPRRCGQRPRRTLRRRGRGLVRDGPHAGHGPPARPLRLVRPGRRRASSPGARANRGARWWR